MLADLSLNIFFSTLENVFHLNRSFHLEDNSFNETKVFGSNFKKN